MDLTDFGHLLELEPSQSEIPPMPDGYSESPPNAPYLEALRLVSVRSTCIRTCM